MATNDEIIKHIAEKAAAKEPLEEFVIGNTKIGLRKPSGSGYLRAIEIGNGNAMLTSMCEALMCVATVNGEAQSPITSRNRLDALSDRIGRDGVEAVMGWYQETQHPEINEVLAELTASGEEFDPNDPRIGLMIIEKRKAKIKNLPRTQ